MNPLSETRENFTDSADRRAMLAEILSKDYISICDVDARTGDTLVLQSTKDRELEGCRLPWDELMQRYARRRAYPDDRDAVISLTLEKLVALPAQKNGRLTLEIRCIEENHTFEWVEMAISVLSATEHHLLVTTRSINENRILKRIVELFVYRNLDYFVLLDAKRNSYMMFNGKQGSTTLPPIVCDDYTAEMVRYNKKYVLPEDFERVTANMQIPHVIEMLEKADQYSFPSGGITDQGNYRRTQVQFQYYDKTAKLILLTRIDTTQTFLEEQTRNMQLSTALRDAQQDALTGIYNQKATTDLVRGLLERQYRNGAALLFLDVDNFKMVNDTLGHQEGDHLLRYLAGAIRDIAGRSGIAGRVGGDEFVIFLPSISTVREIRHYAGRLCRIFDSFPDPLMKSIPLSCSVGIATYPLDGTDYETLVRKADQALYTAKRYGKNQFYFYSHSPRPQI